MRARGDQALQAGIDPGSEAFEGPGSEQREIARLAEDGLVDGQETLGAQDHEPDRARDRLAVGHHELEVLLHWADARGAQERLGDPGVLGARIDEHARHGCEALRLAKARELGVDAEGAHAAFHGGRMVAHPKTGRAASGFHAETLRSHTLGRLPTRGAVADEERRSVGSSYFGGATPTSR